MRVQNLGYLLFFSIFIIESYSQCTINNCEICLDSEKCSKCSDQYYLQSGLCLRSCQAGYYANQTRMECLDCSAECATCFNNSTNCVYCKNQSKVQFSGSCKYDECPSRYYPTKGTNKVCKPCPQNCESCEEISFLPRCLQCQSEYYLWSGGCFQDCPLLTRFSTIKQKCTSVYETSECPDQRVENLKGECSFVCSPGSYLNQTTRKCLQCADRCEQGCTGPTEMECLTCDSSCDSCMDKAFSSCFSCKSSRQLQPQYQNFWGECFCNLKTEEILQEECQEGTRPFNYRNTLMVLPWLLFASIGLHAWKKRERETIYHVLIMVDYLQQFGLVGLIDQRNELQLDLVLVNYLRIFTPSLWIAPAAFETAQESWEPRVLDGNMKLFTLLDRSPYLASNQAWFLLIIGQVIAVVLASKLLLPKSWEWTKKIEHTLPTFFLTFSQISIALDLVLFGQNYPTYTGSSVKVVSILLCLGIILLNLGFFLYLWQRFQIKTLLESVHEEREEGGFRGLNSSQSLLISIRKLLGALMIGIFPARPQIQAAFVFTIQLIYSIFMVYQISSIRRKRKSTLILTEIFVCVIFLLLAISASFENKTVPNETIFALLVAFYLLQIISVLVALWQKKEVNTNEEYIQKGLEASQREEQGGNFEKQKVARSTHGRAKRPKNIDSQHRLSMLQSNNSSRAQIILLDESVSNRSSQKRLSDSLQNLQRSSILQPSIKELELQDYDQVINFQQPPIKAQSKQNSSLGAVDPQAKLSATLHKKKPEKYIRSLTDEDNHSNEIESLEGVVRTSCQEKQTTNNQILEKSQAAIIRQENKNSTPINFHEISSSDDEPGSSSNQAREIVPDQNQNQLPEDSQGVIKDLTLLQSGELSQASQQLQNQNHVTITLSGEDE